MTAVSPTDFVPELLAKADKRARAIKLTDTYYATDAEPVQPDPEVLADIGAEGEKAVSEAPAAPEPDPKAALDAPMPKFDTFSRRMAAENEAKMALILELVQGIDVEIVALNAKRTDLMLAYSMCSGARLAYER